MKYKELTIAEVKGKIDFGTREEAEKEIAKLNNNRRIRKSKSKFGEASFIFTVVEVDPAGSLGPMPIAELHIGRTLAVALNTEFDQKWQEYKCIN